MFRFAGILFFSDAVAALISHLVGQYVRLGGLQAISELEVVYSLQTMIYTIVVLLSGYFCELYTTDRYISCSVLASRVAVSIMFAFFILAACFYAAPDMAPGRGVLALSLLVFGVLQYLIHRIWNACQNLSHFSQKVMILGVGPLAEVISRSIPLSSNNYIFAGYIQPESTVPTVPFERIIGSVKQIEEILARENVKKLVVSITDRRGTLPVRNLLTCKMRGIEILDSPTFYEELTGKLLIEDIQPS